MGIWTQTTTDRLAAAMCLAFIPTIVFSATVAFADEATSGDSRTSSLSFNRDVRPILNQHCVACHGGVKQAADLSFVYEDSALSMIEVGDAESSYLIERVVDDSEDRMPPPEHGRALNQAEIATLKQWIDQGAKWDGHWSFSPPQLQDLPELPGDDWSRSRVDSFVLAKLRSMGLNHSVDASPERWLRRVSLDLIGIPPTPEEREQFLSEVRDSGETAYEATVDRLLQHPGFGERWATVWLDAVRYADSKGLGQDGRRTIWKYRDWVIRALNTDLPYDEFTRKQIAGDLYANPAMDDLVATAVHRLTQTNEEGGTDDEMFRVEALIDRVNTTWQAWQGISFGCVQCHSHPYDPIEHEEYYQFLAFFNNTADTDLPNELPIARVPLDDTAAPRAMQLDRQIKETWLQVWKPAEELLRDASLWVAPSKLEASTNNSTRVEVVENDGKPEYQTQGTVARNTTVVLSFEVPEGVDQITALRFTGFPQDLDQALRDSEWGYVISHFGGKVTNREGESRPLEFAFVVADEPTPLLDPQGSLNEKSADGAGPYSRIHVPRKTAFVLADPIPVTSGDKIEVSVNQRRVETGAFPLVAKRGRIEFSSSPDWTNWWNDPQIQERKKEWSRLRGERRKIASVSIPVLAERYEPFSRSSYVFDRGNYLTKTDKVEADVPAFLPELPNLSGNDAPSRLALAEWMASPQNPLTARVAVNRVWASLFGVGLVETQEDFGSAGGQPSHPRLLDDLAARFQGELGWSHKQLLRELTLSSTYRQSAVVSEASLQLDPQNRYLSRGPRVRLSAEVIRDQALAIAGLLSDKAFGPPVHPPIPADVWKPFQGGDKWPTPDTTNPDRYRRSIYTYVKRSIPYPMFASFDAPSREFCSVRRQPSNTPLQALMTLNDQTYVEASAALAEKMLQHSEQLQEQISYGFIRATAREPNANEVNALKQLFHQATESSEQERMRQVAMVLLNLDEVFSK